MSHTTNTAGGPADDRLPPALLKVAGIIMLGAIMMQLDMTMTNIAINTLLHEFNTTLATIQWVGTGYLLAMATVIPLAGWSLERFGARTIWMASIGVFLVGSILCGVAWSAGSLIAFRVLQGVGGGMILPLAQAILAQAAGPRRLGRIMAVMGVPAILGPVLGPVIGGVIVDDLTWRWIFYVNVPVCLLALLLSPRVIPAERAPGASRLDVLGLLLLSPASAALVFGMAEAGRHGGFDHRQALIPLVIGIALLAAFTLHALRTKAAPLIDLRLLRVRSFAASAAAMFIAGLVLFGAMGVLPLYYQQVRGDSPSHTGLLIVPMGVGLGLSLAVAGRLTDRLAPRWIALAGLACTVAGTLVYTQVGAHTSDLLLGVAQAFSGAGIGATMVPIMTASLRGLRRDAIPRASTAIRIFQQLGSSFGSAVLFVVLQRQITDRTADSHGHVDAALLAGAFGATFWWVIVFAAIALVPTLFLPGTLGEAASAEDFASA